MRKLHASSFIPSLLFACALSTSSVEAGGHSKPWKAALAVVVACEATVSGQDGDSGGPFMRGEHVLRELDNFGLPGRQFSPLDKIEIARQAAGLVDDEPDPSSNFTSTAAGRRLLQYSTTGTDLWDVVNTTEVATDPEESVTDLFVRGEYVLRELDNFGLPGRQLCPLDKIEIARRAASEIDFMELSENRRRLRANGTTMPNNKTYLIPMIAGGPFLVQCFICLIVLMGRKGVCGEACAKSTDAYVKKYCNYCVACDAFWNSLTCGASRACSQYCCPKIPVWCKEMWCCENCYKEGMQSKGIIIAQKGIELKVKSKVKEPGKEYAVQKGNKTFYGL